MSPCERKQSALLKLAVYVQASQQDNTEWRTIKAAVPPAMAIERAAQGTFRMAVNLLGTLERNQVQVRFMPKK